MEKRLRAACFYQEKEDETSVDGGPFGDTHYAVHRAILMERQHLIDEVLENGQSS